jgi:hypothetical protein
MTIWRMRIEYCIPKATNAHTEYVLHIAVSLQKWLHDAPNCYVIRTSPVLFSKHVTCLVHLLNLGTIIQRAYKLSEYFAKPYFHKHWTEIHAVTTIWKSNVCSFISAHDIQIAIGRRVEPPQNCYIGTYQLCSVGEVAISLILVYAFPARCQ